MVHYNTQDSACKLSGGTCVACAGRLVHRLDRNTSGALVVARTADAAAWLSQAFRLPAHGLSAGQPPPVARGVPSVEKHYQVQVQVPSPVRGRQHDHAGFPVAGAYR